MRSNGLWIGWVCAAVWQIIAGGMLARAGPWTLPARTAVAELSTAYTTFDEVRIFDRSRARVPRAEFFSTALQAALGLSDRLQLSLFVPHEQSSLAAPIVALGVPARRFHQVADGRLALKYLLVRDRIGSPFAMATELELKVPVEQYRTDTLSAPGDSQTDVTFRLVAGRAFEPGSCLSQLSCAVGYRLRAQDPANEFLATLEAGFKPAGRLQATLVLDTVRSTGDVGLLSPELIGLAVQRGGVVPFARVAETYTKASAILSYDLGEGLCIRFFGSDSIEVRDSSFDTSAGLSLGYEFR